MLFLRLKKDGFLVEDDESGIGEGAMLCSSTTNWFNAPSKRSLNLDILLSFADVSSVLILSTPFNSLVFKRCNCSCMFFSKIP